MTQRAHNQPTHTQPAHNQPGHSQPGHSHPGLSSEKKIATVILAAHGQINDGNTEVPKGVRIHFYQPFGQPLGNEEGKQIQAQLSRDGKTTFPSVALWQGPTSQKPSITLHAERQGDFISGFIIVGTPHREQLAPNKVWNLQYVCQEAQRRCPDHDIELHYLACLTK